MSDRVVDFTIKATDTSKQTIDQVVASVKVLTATLEGQVKASLSGATSAADFGKALDGVKKIAAELTSQKISIGDFDNKSAKVDVAIDRLHAIKAAQAAYIAGIANGNEITSKEITQLERFERAISTADRAVSRTIETYVKSGDALGRLGIDTSKLGEANQLLNRTLGQVADTLRVAGEADMQFIANKQRAAIETARWTERLVEQEAAAKKAAAATAELTKLQSLANEVASRAATARPPTPDTAAPVQTLQERVQDRLRTPAQIAETQGPLGSKDTVLGNYGEMARLNGELVSGTRAAGEYRKELRELSAAETELQRQAGVVDGFIQQKAALDAASTAFHKAQEEVRQLNAAIQATPNPEIAADLTKQLNPAASRFTSAQTALTGAQSGYDRERLALTALGIEVDEVGAAQRRLLQTTALATEARIADTARERAALLNLAVQADASAEAVRVRLNAGQPLASVGGPGSGTSAVRDALAGIGTARDIGNAAEELDRLEKKLRTGTLTAHTYHDQMNEIYAIQRKIASDTGLVERFDQQQVAVARAQAAFAAADVELQKVLRDAAAGNASMRDVNGAQAGFTSASGSLSKQLEDRAKLSAELKRNGIDTNNLAADTARLATMAERLAEVEARAGKMKTGGFQFNVGQIASMRHEIEASLTQLAMGDGILQVAMSHIGQSLYTFNVPVENFIKYLPVVGAVVAVFGTLAAAAAHVQAELLNLRVLDGILAANADGVTTTTAAMYDAEKATQALGASFKEASESVQEFFKAGVNPERIKDFAKAAFDLTEVYGGKLPEASKKVATAFTGGYDAIKNLNHEYNFMSAAVARSVLQAFEEGHAIEGRTIAFDAFLKMMGDGADKSRTNWSVAVRELKVAWDDLMTSLGRSNALSNVASYFRDIVQSMTTMTRFLNGELSFANFNRQMMDVGRKDAVRMGPDQEKLNDLLPKRDNLKTTIDFYEKQKPGDLGSVSPERLAELKAQLAELDTQIAALRTGANIEGIKTELEKLKRDRDELVRRGATLETGERAANLTPTTSVPGAPAGYSALRDSIADKVGLDREALARVQRVEGVPDGQGGWKHSNTGVTGPMQVTHATFAELRQQHPDIGEDINDPEANTTAGAYYLRDQLKKSGGDLAGAYGTYNGVSAETARAVPAERNGVSIAGYSGQALTNPQSALTALNSRIAALEGQVEHGTEPGGAPKPVTQADTERTKGSNEEYIRLADRETDALRNRNARALEAWQFEERQLGAMRERLNLEASKDGRNPDDPDVRASNERRIAVERGILDERRHKADEAERQKAVQAQQAIENAISTARAKNDNNDKTNAEARRRAVDEAYAKDEALFRKAEEAKAPDFQGKPLDAYRAELEAAKNKEKDNVTAEADEAAVTKVLEERKASAKRISEDLKSGAISVSTAFERSDALTKQFAPRIRDAIAAANADLTKQGGANPSPRIRAALATNAAIRPDDPTENTQLTNEGFSELEKYTKGRNSIRATEKELESDHLETTAEGEAKIKRYYEETRGALEKLIATLRVRLELERTAGTVSAPEYERRSAELTKASADTQYVPQFNKDLEKTFDNSVSSHAVSSVDTIGKSVGNLAGGVGKLSDVWRSAGAAAAEFASGILKDVANMIIKYEVLALVQSTLGQKSGSTPDASGGGGGGGGGGQDQTAGMFAGLLKMGAGYMSGGMTSIFSNGALGNIFGGTAGGASGADTFGGLNWGGMSGGGAGVGAGSIPMAAPLSHGGGIIGSTTMSRPIDPAAFVNAVRYHAGGTVGLSHDEVPTILQRGEEVITRNDARHVMNGGKAGGGEATPQRNIKQVLVFDPRQLSEAMSGSHGEDVTITHIRNNADKINSVLGR